MLIHINSLPLIQVPLLNEYDWLLHGFGTKDIPIENYLKAFGLPQAFVPKTHQSHGNAVRVLKSDSKVHSPQSIVHGPVFEGDAFVTDQSNIVCWVRTADCLPILLADTKTKAVGAVHAGWRGTAAKVVLEAIGAMQKGWNTQIVDLKIALGPAICGRCYRVGVDVIKDFEKAGLYPGPWIEEVDKGHWHLDIAFANLYPLEQAGIRRHQIYFSLACTACDLEKFHSYRRENGKKGEQVSFILIQP